MAAELQWRIHVFADNSVERLSFRKVGSEEKM